MIKNYATTILTLLSDVDKKKDIIEVENISDNKELLNYLESIGNQEIQYDIDSSFRPGLIQETGGKTYLWYKQANGVWIIKLWEINRLL